MKEFFKAVIDGNNSTSSKRLVTLIISLHFILASFAILFISFYVVFYIPRGTVDEKLLSLLKEVLEYDFYIILSGLGFITADGLTSVLLKKFESKMPKNDIPLYSNEINPDNHA